jgi:hypothetical protein
VFFFKNLCTFFAFFASAYRRSRYIRYRDNIGDNQYGESYNIGNKQYSSKNLSYCPIHRFLESVTLLTRHISGLFQALGIQYRWILTSGDLARQLVTTADLAIDDANETAWMALHEHERDLLEDTMYQRLVALWSGFSVTITVFDANTAAQQLCEQKVWEALLAAFPLEHKRMQTVLLAREMASMMKLDGYSKHVVNIHFGKVNETRQALG